MTEFEMLFMFERYANCTVTQSFLGKEISTNDQSMIYPSQGTVETWKRCPKNFSTYTADVTSSVAYQKNLTETGLRALIYRFLSSNDNSFPFTTH